MFVATKDIDNNPQNLKGFIFFRKWLFQMGVFSVYQAFSLSKGTPRKVQNARPEAGFLSYNYPITKDLNASLDLCQSVSSVGNTSVYTAA